MLSSIKYFPICSLNIYSILLLPEPLESNVSQSQYNWHSIFGSKSGLAPFRYFCKVDKKTLFLCTTPIYISDGIDGRILFPKLHHSTGKWHNFILRWLPFPIWSTWHLMEPLSECWIIGWLFLLSKTEHACNSDSTRR